MLNPSPVFKGRLNCVKRRLHIPQFNLSLLLSYVPSQSDKALFKLYVFALYFSSFKNGLGAFLWHCSLIALKYVKRDCWQKWCKNVKNPFTPNESECKSEKDPRSIRDQRKNFKHKEIFHFRFCSVWTRLNLKNQTFHPNSESPVH